jgi:hypothetical protein
MIKITGLTNVIKYLNVELGFSFADTNFYDVFWHEVLDYHLSPEILPSGVRNSDLIISVTKEKEWDFTFDGKFVFITCDSSDYEEVVLESVQL